MALKDFALTGSELQTDDNYDFATWKNVQSLRSFVAFKPSEYLPDFFESERRFKECKMHVIAHPVINIKKRQLVRIDDIPYSCKAPYCKKCTEEKIQSQFAYVYPYCKAHPRRTVKHVMFTTPVIPISDLDKGLEDFDKHLTQLEEFLSTAKISKKKQKQAQSGIIFFEPHYQPQTGTFNLHVHVGFFCFVDIGLLQRFWNDIWGNPTPSLNVRYPQYMGKIRYETSKFAFSKYISKRRVEIGLRTPTLTYYKHFHHRQLIRLFGLTRKVNKVYFTQVQIIRKNLRAKLAFQIPLHADEQRFRGISLPSWYNRAKFADFLQRELALRLMDIDLLTDKEIVSMSLREARNSMLDAMLIEYDNSLILAKENAPTIRNYIHVVQPTFVTKPQEERTERPALGLPN